LDSRSNLNKSNFYFQAKLENKSYEERKLIVSSKLNKLYNRSKLYPNNIIDRNLYSFLYNTDFLTFAYENLINKPNLTNTQGQLSLHLTKQPNKNLEFILAPKRGKPSEAGQLPKGFVGIDKIKEISELLKSEKFTFSRKITILSDKVKPGQKGSTCLLKRDCPSQSSKVSYLKGGKQEKLIEASNIDKIVLEGIRLILEAIYEPLFLENLHGVNLSYKFNYDIKLNRNSHIRYQHEGALNYINQHFQSSQ